MTSSNDTLFHARHEELTELIYNGVLMLPSRYVFVLTLMCNMNCSFCPQEHRISKNDLSFEQWNAIIEQLPPYARVTLTGGEPLLYKNFKEIFHTIALKFDTNCITNGSLLTPSIIDFILSYEKFKVLSISIDTIKNTNRQYTYKQWKNLIDGIQYFHKKRKELSHNAILDIKTVVCDENVFSLHTLYTYIKNEIKPDTHAFQFLKGSPLQHASQMVSFDKIFVVDEAPVLKDFKRVFEGLHNIKNTLVQEKGKVFLHPPMFSIDMLPSDCNDFGYFLNSTTFDKNDFEPCKFPWSSMHINPNGDVFPCLAVCMGNLGKNTLEEIIHGDNVKHFRKAMTENGLLPSCNRCGWLRKSKQQKSVIF